MSGFGEVQRIETVYADRTRRGLDARYGASRPAALLERQQMERGLIRLLDEECLADLSGLRILDVGSGDGNLLLRLMSLGARSGNLCGVDLLDHRLAEGRRRCPSLPLLRADGRRLPLADGAFDVSLQCTLLSSVGDDGVLAEIAAEMRRVTRPGGRIIWYDMRITRPDNHEVRPVGVREARALYPDAEVRSRVVTLNPVLARRTAPVSWPLAELLGAIPFLCGHRLTVIRVPERAEESRRRAA